MKISIFNGSPRGEKSNSTVINKWLAEGFVGHDYNEENENEKESKIENRIKQHIIRNIKNHDMYIDEMAENKKVVITFPLYADGMPAIVMRFFEKIYENREKLSGTEYLFVIHSGFPEAKHCYGLRDYLTNFVEKVNGKLYETIIYGGSEGTRLAPEKSQKKKRNAFNNIGSAYSKGIDIESADRNRLMKPLQLSKGTQLAFKLLSKTSLLNVYWDSSLKKNNAFEKRFDQPYL